MLPGFEKIFEQLCHLIVDTAALVARSCDRYGVAKLEGYRPGTLEDIVRTSVSTKARLLHYFPPTTEQLDCAAGNDDDWCAIHHDIGALTGLTCQMFVDETAHDPRAVPDSSGLLPPLPELDNHVSAVSRSSGPETLIDISLYRFCRQTPTPACGSVIVQATRRR